MRPSSASAKSHKQFPDVSPIDKAPSLRTINTCGFKLHGKSDFDFESDSYITTQYFVVLFLPIFPLPVIVLFLKTAMAINF